MGLRASPQAGKSGSHLHRIASGVPEHSNASRGKTAFHIHWCFLRKGRKGTREEKKEQGTPFVSVSNMVPFDFSFSIVKGSPGALVCYQAGLYLPACVKVAQLLPWMRLTRHIYLPGILWALGPQGSSSTRSTKAGLYRKSRPSLLFKALCVDSGGQRALPPFLPVRWREEVGVEVQYTLPGLSFGQKSVGLLTCPPFPHHSCPNMKHQQNRQLFFRNFFIPVFPYQDQTEYLKSWWRELW